MGGMFRPLTFLISSHEYKMYQMIADIPGVPPVGPRFGRRGFFHRYIEGKTLYELKKDSPLPEHFFSELRKILDAIHNRRILCLDVQKLGNIILSDEGSPYLIDHQISLFLPKRRGILGKWSDRIFEFFVHIDLYHLYKHKRRFQKDRMTDKELKLAQRSHLNSLFYQYVGQPYRAIKR